MKTKITLAFILLLALFLRSYNLSSVPPHPNWDEVSIGYNALSIIETGKDEWSKSFPLIFRAYGDYKLPVYVYLTAPLIKIFGLSTLSIRLLSAIAGVVTVFFTYLLAQDISKNKKAAMFASLLVAIEPWSLFLSRIALEANLALALIISGFYFLNKNNAQKFDYVISSLLLGLSVWTYNSARIFIPLALLSWAIINKKVILSNLKNFLVPIIILSIFIVPMFVQLLTQTGSARYENVKILDQGAIARIIELRQTSNFSDNFERLLYNKATIFVIEFSKNYLDHYKIDYLFQNGGDNYQFNVPYTGLIYEINFIFIIFGITWLAFKNRKAALFLFAWFLVAPIAASLTRETPHTLRNIVFLPLPMIFSSLGISFVLSYINKHKKVLLVFYFLTLFFSSLKYLSNLFNVYPTKYSSSWQYGYKDSVDYISKNYDKYDKIIITKKYGEPHEFLLYFGYINNQKWAKPQNYQQDKNLVRFYQSNWYWVDRFDKFYFMNDWQIPQSISEKWILESKEEIDVNSGSVLLITSPGNYPKEWKKESSIYFLDQTPAFDIVTKI